MKVASGRVVAGRIVVEGEPLEEGCTVTVLAPERDEAECVAKFWLEPEPGIAHAYGLTSGELRELLGVAIEKRELIRRYWNEHFGV